MIALPAAALIWQLFDGKNWLAGVIGLITIGLQVWMVIEAAIAWPKVKGVLEPQLNQDEVASTQLNKTGGRSC